MNNTCMILILAFALVSCTLSSYLDIPAPPERPMRFKTKEQIENYLKAVKDYYDAFKVKLVRRENLLLSSQDNFDQSTSNDDDDDLADLQQAPVDTFKRFYRLYRRNAAKSNAFEHHREEEENQFI